MFIIFHSCLESEILNDHETDLFMKLLMKNNKFIGNEWDLLYRKSLHQRFDDQKYVKQQYENNRDVIFIVALDSNMILGGYSSVGWKSGGGFGPDEAVYSRDDKAYIFGIKSMKQDDKPFICNVKPERADHAIRSQSQYYLLFGSPAVIHIRCDGSMHLSKSDCYSPLPMLEGDHRNIISAGKVKDIEIFQIK